jgi:hypothetical protein
MSPLNESDLIAARDGALAVLRAVRRLALFANQNPQNGLAHLKAALATEAGAVRHARDELALVSAVPGGALGLAAATAHEFALRTAMVLVVNARTKDPAIWPAFFEAFTSLPFGRIESLIKLESRWAIERLSAGPPPL